MRVSYVLGWVFWTVLIAIIVWPWGDVLDHPHWVKVAWIPFASPPVKAFDIVANTLLYMPFGYLGTRALAGRRSALLLVAASMVLSVSTEYVQLYSHWRFPSATDVMCNVLGCCAGVLCLTWQLPQKLKRIAAAT